MGSRGFSSRAPFSLAKEKGAWRGAKKKHAFLSFDTPDFSFFAKKEKYGLLNPDLQVTPGL